MADGDTNFPAFSLSKPRFDQGTFYGRLRHFLDVVDPRTLFTTQEKLQESLDLVQRYQDGNLDQNVTNKQLWEAHKIKQAILHPDTGKKIMMPFRMSGFVPFGSPIVVGLLLPNLTVPKMIFWQWLNQTHNACINYSNRNATKPTPTSRFVLGYTAAVSSAVGIAVGLSQLIKKADKFSSSTKVIVQKFVPFPAVATASVCNVVLMRNSELSEGILVTDKDGTDLGSSTIAAKKALLETAVTRAILPAPILLIPPTIMTVLEKTSLLVRNPSLHLPINAAMVTLCFGLALPVAISLFPQISKIKTSKLEKHIQDKCKDEFVFYNKGL